MPRAKKVVINDNEKIACFIPVDGWVKGKGHRVAFVKANDPLIHLTGGGDVEPWYWGNGTNAEDSFEQAYKIAANYNKRLGISQEEADEIVLQSMKLSNELRNSRN